MSKPAKALSVDGPDWDKLNADTPLISEQEKLLVDSLLKLDPARYTEKRKHKRALLYGTVAIYDQAGKVLNRGQCVNLNISGAAFSTKVGPPKVGEFISCELNSKTKCSTLTAKCKVIRVQENPNSKADANEAQLVGVLFVEMSKLSQKKVTEYLTDVFGDTGFNEEDK